MSVPLGVILYGSFAHGEPDQYSDIDNCIIVPDKYKDRMKSVLEGYNGRHFIVIFSDSNVRTMVRAKDFFFCGEVLGKGRILGQYRHYVDNLIVLADSTEPDFEAARMLHTGRFMADYEGLCTEGTFERLMWCYTDLINLRLTQTGRSARSLEEVPDMMEKDDVLDEYVCDFLESMRLNKDVQHHRILFSREDFKHLCARMLKLKNHLYYFVNLKRHSGSC